MALSHMSHALSYDVFVTRSKAAPAGLRVTFNMRSGMGSTVWQGLKLPVTETA